MASSSQNHSTTPHSSLLLGAIPKLNDTNKVDWKIGIKTYLRSRRLWKYVEREIILSDEDQKDPDKVEDFEAERAGVLEIIRATVLPTRLPLIRGIEDSKRAYDLLLEQVSQDDGLEVAALIAKVANTRYPGTGTVSSYLDEINDLHTQLAEATSEDPELKISDKLLAVFLLLSFPGDQFGTIRDQLFGDLKSLSTSKVISRLRTKLALSSVDEVTIAMNAIAKPANIPAAPLFRSDRSPNAPCYLKEHWQFTHSNGVFLKQQPRRPSNPPSQLTRARTQPNTAGQVSDADKIK